MKWIKCSFVFVFVTFFSLCDGAETGYKFYVDANKIVFQGHEILVGMGEEWIATNAIHSDDQGFYITDARWPWTPFFCNTCHLTNPPFNFACERCGTPRPD